LPSSLLTEKDCKATIANRIGVSEKGFVNVDLEVTGIPQHSSFPPKESPIGILGRAVSRVEEKKQPMVFGKGPEKDLFEYVAPDVRTFPQKNFSPFTCIAFFSSRRLTSASECFTPICGFSKT